jgi:predicted dehydrogenase
VIRTVLAGYGRFGSIYASRLADHPAFDVIGVVEPDEEAQSRLMRDGFRGWDELATALVHERPELVVVASVESEHARLAEVALRSGAHVVLAKPGATSTVEAEHVAACATKYERSLCVDYTPMWMRGWALLRAEVESLGRVQSVRCVRRDWSRPRAAGVLWDLAPHDVAMILSLNATDQVVGVASEAWGTGVILVVRFASGKVARVECDYTSAQGRERSIEIVAEDGHAAWIADDDVIVTSSGRRIACVDEPDAITKHLDRICRVVTDPAEADDAALYRRVCSVLEAAQLDHLARNYERAHTRCLAVAA